jgi:exodeoxyribonuclease V alpha subunit
LSRDRADLGLAHAAQLAAAEAARYALPRPLDHAVADLHAAWTGEQQCLDRLALAESRRDLLRHIREREAGDADRLTTLDASCRQTARDAGHTRQLADTSTAAVAAEADRLRDRLLTAWDAQRATASQAAQIVLDGPGRLGLRRVAVARAGVQLTAWADTWRPYLPTLPSDPHRIAAVAGAADDRPRLQAAFDARVRRHAQSFHPEHSQLMAAADAARAAHDRARRELDHARRERRDRLARSEATGQPFNLTARLADAERDVAGTQQELKAARTRIEQLRQEPALLSQSADSLARERDRWHARHDLEDTPRPPASPSVRPQLFVRPPSPEDVRRLARHPDAGLRTPR